jgi:nitroreductase
MTTKLGLSVDEVLTTTRAVRKRLDTTRPVPRSVIEECLDLALQAPNGSNRNTWRWLVIDDPDTIAKLADEYKAAMGLLNTGAMPTPNPLGNGIPGEDKILESAYALVDKLPHMPAILIPLMPGRPDGTGVVEQASMWGSIVQAVWSFMLALRERGLGSIWATVTTRREREIANLLGIPYDDYTQIGMFPIAYTIGTDFKRAWRRPIEDVLDYNRFEPRGS